jgi:hypothetical protein
MMNEALRLYAALLCLPEGASEQDIKERFIALSSIDGNPMPALLSIAQQLKNRIDVTGDSRGLKIGIQLGDFGFNDEAYLFGAISFDEVALRKKRSMKINQERFSRKGVMH